MRKLITVLLSILFKELPFYLLTNEASFKNKIIGKSLQTSGIDLLMVDLLVCSIPWCWNENGPLDCSHASHGIVSGTATFVL